MIIHEIMNNGLPENPSVIFDIDGTFFDKDTFAPYESIISFYNYCINNGFTVFIVTARPGYKDNISRTIDYLKNIGITRWKGIYFVKDRNINVPRYKIKARKNIKNRGYNTVMSLGDNMHDIGKYGGVGVIIK